MPDFNQERPLAELDSLKAPRWGGERASRVVAGILAAAEPLLRGRRPRTSSIEVLAGWARPGLIAAAVTLAVASAASIYFSATRAAPAAPVALDDVLTGGPSGTLPTVLVASTAPDANAVIEVAFLEGEVPQTRNGRDQE